MGRLHHHSVPFVFSQRQLLQSIEEVFPRLRIDLSHCFCNTAMTAFGQRKASSTACVPTCHVPRFLEVLWSRSEPSTATYALHSVYSTLTIVHSAGRIGAVDASSQHCSCASALMHATSPTQYPQKLFIEEHCESNT